MGPSQDLFSLLPETLLITILSFLPLKDAVRTSVLATHWRNLWRSRPNIEINERYFRPPHQENQNDTELRIRQFSCVIFGRTWLNPLKYDFSTLSSFALMFSNPLNHKFDIEFFIHFALDRQTKSLELDFSGLDWSNSLPVGDSDTYSERFTLPNFVYQHQGLEALKLVSCSFRDDQLINLGRTLRSVSLGWIEMKASILSNLMSSCPHLESLSLFKCFNLTMYVIESKSLKRLRVDKCVDLLNLSVLAPNLESFMYCGNVVEFGMTGFPLLQEVDLDFGLADFFDADNGDVIINLLSNFYFADSLRVCAYITQVLPMGLGSPRLPGQARAKELTIRTVFHEYEFYGMLCLLNSFPLLEKLCFEVGQQYIFHEDYVVPMPDFSSDTFWSTVKPLATGCVKNALKIVEVKGFRGIQHELHVLEFLLEHGHAIRKVTLRMREDDQHARTTAMQLKDRMVAKLSQLDVLIIYLGYDHLVN